MNLPSKFKNAVHSLEKLPSIGPRTAERLVLYLLKRPPGELETLADSIKGLSEGMFCKRCYNFSEESLCSICQDERRNNGILCVVEDQLDLLAIEEKNIHSGTYHILGGSIRIGQRDNSKKLKIPELIARIKKEKIKEIIIATNPTTGGDMTAVLVKESLGNFKNIKITRISRGLPTGGDLEYADQESLGGSFLGRRKF